MKMTKYGTKKSQSDEKALSVANNILEELINYAPHDEVEGNYGMRWLWDNDFVHLEHMNDVLKARRTQFLRGEYGPNYKE